MRHQQAAQRHLNLTKEDDNYCSSSDDDDNDDAGDKDVLKTLVKSFNLPSGACCYFTYLSYHWSVNDCSFVYFRHIGLLSNI